jgi:sodium pump decarboxylase gamma subunit
MGNLGWGLQITVLGMGIVFGVLLLLWGVLNLIMRFDRAPPAAVVAPAPASGAEAVASGPAVHEVPGLAADLVAAIVVATLAHKHARRQAAAPAMRIFWPGSLLHVSRWVASGRIRQTSGWQRGRR